MPPAQHYALVSHVDHITSEINALQIVVNSRFEEVSAKIEALQQRLARLEGRVATPSALPFSTPAPQPHLGVTLEPTIPPSYTAISGPERTTRPLEGRLIVSLEDLGRECYTLLVYYDKAGAPRNSPVKVLYELGSGELRGLNAQANTVVTKYVTPRDGRYSFVTYAEFLLRALQINPIVTAIWNVTSDATA